jgi:NADPH:quinone reductase-like Zn-dependent oxidoreductase
MIRDDQPTTMAAAIVGQVGRPARIGTAPRPAAGPDEMLVAVSAAPINPFDLWLASGEYYVVPDALPYIPGSEGVGRVVSAPTVERGTRVWFISPASLAEFVAVSEQALVPLPDEIDDATAAALGVAGTAGYRSRSSRPGDGRRAALRPSSSRCWNPPLVRSVADGVYNVNGS